MRRRRSAPASPGSRPNTLTSPASRFRRPSRHSMVVVLPAPFGPTRPKTSFSATENEMPSTATMGHRPCVAHVLLLQALLGLPAKAHRLGPDHPRFSRQGHLRPTHTGPLRPAASQKVSSTALVREREASSTPAVAICRAVMRRPRLLKRVTLRGLSRRVGRTSRAGPGTALATARHLPSGSPPQPAPT